MTFEQLDLPQIAQSFKTTAFWTIKVLNFKPSEKKIFADSGYQGELAQWLKKKLGLDIEIVKRTESDKWTILPKRWIVERTFAWLMNFRRLVMDYERTIESVESHIYIAMMILMGKKLN